MRVSKDTLICSDQSFIFKAIVAIRTDDYMIKNGKFKQCTYLYRPFGELDIRLTRLALARRMVMTEDDSAGVGFQGNGKYDFGIYVSSCQSALRNIHYAEHMVCPIEQYNFKFFQKFNFIVTPV